MNLSEIRGALQTLTALVEGAAESVLDATFQSKANDEDYEFIGFASRKNTLLKEQPSDEEEAFKLLDMTHDALAQRMAGRAVVLTWRLKPEFIVSEHGMRIGCRIRVKAALIKPKLVAVT